MKEILDFDEVECKFDYEGPHAESGLLASITAAAAAHFGEPITPYYRPPRACWDVYLDTPALDLYRSGASLRLRRVNNAFFEKKGWSVNFKLPLAPVDGATVPIFKRREIRTRVMDKEFRTATSWQELSSRALAEAGHHLEETATGMRAADIVPVLGLSGFRQVFGLRNQTGEVFEVMFDQCFALPCSPARPDEWLPLIAPFEIEDDSSYLANRFGFVGAFTGEPYRFWEGEIEQAWERRRDEQDFVRIVAAMPADLRWGTSTKYQRAVEGMGLTAALDLIAVPAG